eukprot:1934745-Rhodomonas_salina.1
MPVAISDLSKTWGTNFKVKKKGPRWIPGSTRVDSTRAPDTRYPGRIGIPHVQRWDQREFTNLDTEA